MNNRRLTRSTIAIALTALAAVLIAACGGAKKPPASGSTNTSNKNNVVQAAYRYSACMRTHGVTNFQDPHVHANGNAVQIAVRVDPSITGSPHFKSAQQACAHIMPGMTTGPTQDDTQAHTEALLAFARCMREHGFPKFPDPNTQGRLDAAMLSAAGIDLQQPAIKPAAYACAPLTHGIISRSDINQAIANPNGGSHSASAGG